MAMVCSPLQLNKMNTSASDCALLLHAQVEEMDTPAEWMVMDALDSMLLQMGKIAAGLCRSSGATPSRSQGQETEQAKKHEN
jgi:hypothetical protein